MSVTITQRRVLAGGLVVLAALVLAAVWTARDTIRSPDSPASIVANDEPAGDALSTKAIAAKSLAATVQVRAIDALGSARGNGTGFFLSEDGLLVTSLHVINGAHSLEVRTLYGTSFDSVQFVAADAKHDLALLKVAARETPSLRLAGGADPEIGEAVFVSGNPLGQTGTFSDGLVSARRAAEGITFLQITAPVSSGSSGGPVLNDRGHVIGVTTLRLQRGQNLNYAIPARYLKRLVDSATAPVAYRRALLPLLQRPPLFVAEQAGAPVGHTDTTSDVITRQLRTADSLLKALRGSAEETQRDSLAADDSTSRTMNLKKGREYVVAGFCDEHCGTLSLVMRSPTGEVVDYDRGVDDVPKLRFTAPVDGRYVLQVIMSDCDMKKCAAGVRSYVLVK